MKRTLLCTAVVISILHGSVAFAQTEIETRIQTSRGYRLPVAVESFELGSGSASPEMLKWIENIAEIIRGDLAFSGYFKLVLFDSLYLKLMGKGIMDLQAWSHMGAEYLCRGRVSPRGDGFRLVLKLEATGGSREVVFEKSFTGLWSKRRVTAHQISEEIILYLWGGRTNLFQTHIVASWKSGGKKNLYLFDYDGFNARPLTNYGEYNMSPCWFPAGDRLVFTSNRDNNWDLWLLLLKNNSTTRISNRPGLNSAPAVWPDGRYVVVTLSKDGNSELYLLSESGKIARRLTHSPAIDTEPTVSPDGRHIAFSSDRLGSLQVYVMDSDGSNVRRVSFEGNYNASPAWSPRGDKIAFASRNDRGVFDICTVLPDGTGFTRLTTRGSNENPDWSPDGYHLVYSSERGNQKNLYTMTFDGSNERQITTGGGYSNPAWSPYPRR